MKITNHFFRFVFFLMTVISSIVFCGTQRISAQSCDSAFLSTNRDVKSAELGLDLETQVLNKINTAAGKYYQATIKQRQYIHRDLVNAFSLVSLHLAPNLPTDVRNSVQHSLLNLIGCVDSDRRSFGTISIRVLDFTGQTPVGNAKIRVNGFLIGMTSASGTLTFPVRAGNVEVEATVLPAFQKTTSVTIAPGESRSIDVVLDGSKDSYEDSSLILDESNNGILDANFASFTLRFSDRGTTIPLTRLSEVTLLDPPDTSSQAEQSVYLDSLFTVSAAGIITPSNLATLRTAIATRSGVLRLLVEGEDNNGAVHRSEVLFQMGRFQVNVQFQAPPSNPSLVLSGILVKVKSTPGGVIFRLVTNASGVVTLPKMPAGVLEVSSGTFQAGKYYYGQGLAGVSGNFLINVNLLNTTDRLNGVAPFTIIPQFTDLENEPFEKEEYLRRLHTVWTLQPFDSSRQSFTHKDAQTLDEVSVSTTAAAQGVPMSASGNLIIPQGTQTVTLRYNVQTAEYPTFVLPQSIYDDVWSLSVESPSGERLFSISRRVNEQVSVQPTWQANGSTGNKEEVLNVANLTANADITLSVIASATNVSDAQLPTTVQACLGCQSAVNINKVEPDDNVQRSSGKRDANRKKVMVDSEFYSIPRSGETNTLDRYFKLDVSKSSGTTFQSVRTQLVNKTGTVLMTIFDEPVQGSTNIEVVNENTLRVKVTLKPNASTVVTVPPPTDRISYRFRVTVSSSGGQPAQHEKDSAPKKPLWRMPTGFARYNPSAGQRDTGGDDWCALQTYNWLSTNRSRINFIDDVSGEHARDIDHFDHNTGEDMDVFHPYVFTTPANGGSGIGNHLELRSKVFEALTSTTAKDMVRQWVLDSRTRIDGLTALSSVSKVYYSEGLAVQGMLESGWARILLKTGKVTVNGQLLDLALPTPNWSNSKLTNNHTHNSHMHIALVRIP